jgi:NADH:ubiquinone oxidoreductase subunit 6 (subunit J)
MVFWLAQAESSSISAALFWVFALLAGASALGVVISKNIVRMAVFLLGTLAGVAGLYFLLSAEFLAAVQLVVYAGGTLILIIFGVMLTSKSPFSRFAPKPGEVVIALGIGSVLMVSLIWGINRAVTAGVFGNEPYAADSYPMVALGQALLGDFLVPFEVASVLLLVVMIGAAYLAKARRREAESRGI